MPTAPEDLKRRLARYNEIEITVIGRKSGKPITNPVWFVLEGDTLYLLPLQGSDTQWYKNVLQKRASHERNPCARVNDRRAETTGAYSGPVA
jgi:hypothetical protein